MNTVPTIRPFLIGAALVVAAIGADLLLRANGSRAGGLLLLVPAYAGIAAAFVALFWGAPVVGAKLDLATKKLSRSDWVVVCALAVSLCLAVAGAILLDVHEPSAAFWRVYAASLVTVLLVPAGVTVVESVRASGRGKPPRPEDSRRGPTWLWLLLILAIAATTRLAESAASKPPPNASPCTREIVVKGNP